MIEVMIKNKEFEHFSPFARDKLLEDEFKITAEYFSLSDNLKN